MSLVPHPHHQFPYSSPCLVFGLGEAAKEFGLGIIDPKRKGKEFPHENKINFFMQQSIQRVKKILCKCN